VIPIDDSSSLSCDKNEFIALRKVVFPQPLSPYITVTLPEENSTFANLLLALNP
jgi:hypothetical protein